MNSENVALAKQLSELLRRRNAKLVTVESCTAGQIAATLAAVPGISNWFCGGWVVYRSDSKSKWLGVPQEVLMNQGAVSSETSRLLVKSAMENTPEADWGLAITGDLGPGAPATTDGRCFVAIKLGREAQVVERNLILNSPAPASVQSIDARILRLEEATGLALRALIELASAPQSKL